MRRGEDTALLWVPEDAVRNTPACGAGSVSSRSPRPGDFRRYLSRSSSVGNAGIQKWITAETRYPPCWRPAGISGGTERGEGWLSEHRAGSLIASGDVESGIPARPSSRHSAGEIHACCGVEEVSGPSLEGGHFFSRQKGFEHEKIPASAKQSRFSYYPPGQGREGGSSR